MPEALVAGARLHYDITGRGDPLVLTAGQGTGGDARAELVDGLARRYTVLTYDPRGTGRSERVAEGQPIEALADDVRALMDVAGFARARVIGVSTGAGKATALAAMHPERVSRLVLAAPWTHGDEHLTRMQGLRKVAAASLPPDHYAHLNATLLYPPDYLRRHRARLDEVARAAIAAPPDPVRIAARLDAILAFDARRHYPRIACPTLVVGARDDLIMPHWFAADAAAAIGGARLVLLDHGGHLFVESRTADFLALALDFLD